MAWQLHSEIAGGQTFWSALTGGDYVLRADIDEFTLTPVEHRTFCPYKGVCSYYNIGDSGLAAWSYPDAYSEVSRISNLVSFEPDIVSVHLDGRQLRLEPGETVIPHGPDRDLSVDEAIRPRNENERGSGRPPETAAGPLGRTIPLG